MLLQKLEQQELIKPPSFLSTNTHYLCVMGSTSYGVSTNQSDQDIYGVCIPPRDYIFPPNYIEGFDNRDLTFHCWQKHNTIDPSTKTNYDFSIYNIVDFFKLAMDNNPNVIDSLFVRRESIIHITKAFESVRENRNMFLHKGVVYKMKGYAFSQLSKAKNCMAFVKPIRDFEEKVGISHDTTRDQINQLTLTDSERQVYLNLWDAGIKKTSRFEQQKIHGFDLKFCYHIYRLIDQAEYILNHHTLDLQEPHRVEKMKAIRRGDVSFEQIQKDFNDAESRLSDLYQTSSLRMYPPIKEIRALLLSVLESHYGSLAAFIKDQAVEKAAINEIRGVLQKYNL